MQVNPTQISDVTNIIGLHICVKEKTWKCWMCLRNDVITRNPLFVPNTGDIVTVSLKRVSMCIRNSTSVRSNLRCAIKTHFIDLRNRSLQTLYFGNLKKTVILFYILVQTLLRLRYLWRQDLFLIIKNRLLYNSRTLAPNTMSRYLSQIIFSTEVFTI